jgi:acetyltransferase-like isoleucine patch superfamily enzyme
MLSTGCTVDHNCRIGDYAHVSPGANIAGGVVVGEGAYLAIGTFAIPCCWMVAWRVVGAGAAVVKDIPEKCVAMGVPTKAVKIILASAAHV